MKNKITEYLDSINIHIVPLLVLLSMTVVAYYDIPTYKIMGIWDDQQYIVENEAIRAINWQNIKIAFSTYYVGNYAPVQILSYMVDYMLWGMSSFGFLIANVFYHFISGILLYLLLLRHNLWKWGAVIGSAVFLVHPVQMETVAWASQRKNLLAMLFYLLAFHAWLTYREHKNAASWKWYVYSLVLFVLALLSKSVAVIFPLMLVMYDLLLPPVKRRLKEHTDKIPYLLAAGVVGVLALITQQPGSGGGMVEYPRNPFVTIPMTMFPVLVSYLRNVLWPDPSHLSILYYPPLRRTIDGEVIFSCAVLVCLIIVGTYLYKKHKPALFWYCLFFLGLLPVSQIVPLVTRMNDRYLYFPLLGIAGLTACLSNKFRENVGSGTIHKCALLCVVAVVVWLTVAAHIRGHKWQSGIMLFADAAIKYPNKREPWIALAEGYREAGDIDNALSFYEKARSIGMLMEIDQYNIGQIYLERGNYTQAKTYLDDLLKAGPKAADSWFFIGDYYYLTGDYPAAEKALLKYIAAYPHMIQGLFTVGKVYFLMNDYAHARFYYELALSSGGESAELFFSIACLDSMEGRIEQSLDALRQSLEHGFDKRDLVEKHNYLANVRRDPRFRQIVRQHMGEEVK